ncbi:(Fe-S)-binding protein [Candidatus Bathyarchaeota archaeon]|nr:(Fe-S)-binding protein [Candidatus Bathyarchaeota archaeon]
MNEDLLIKKLRRIAGDSNVLTDPADLYVYSFEGPFGLKRNSTPIAIIRLELTNINSITKAIAEISKFKDIQVIYRDDSFKNEIKKNMINSPSILLDLIKIPNLNELKKAYASIKNRAKRIIQSDCPSLMLISILKDRLIYRCLNCSKSAGTECNGYCTVARFFNGIETYSAKGRLILSRGLNKDEIKPTKRLIDSIYNCVTCAQCYAQCALGLDLYEAVIATRKKIVEMGLIPDVFKSTYKNILEHGNPIGMPCEERLIELKELHENGEVLYWVGCITAYRLPEVYLSMIKILKEAKIKFKILKNEGCCGLILWLTGQWMEAKKNATLTLKKIKESSAKILVTNCPGCYYTFKKIYPKFGLTLPVKIFHSSQFLDNLIKNGRLKIKKLRINSTWHDPCDLGRKCGVYDAPRSILRNILDTKLIEMPLNKGYARCCGGGGGVLAFNPDLSLQIASLKIVEDVLPLDVDTLITGCPTCELNFKFAAQSNGYNIKIFDLTEVINNATHKNHFK